MAYFPIFLDLAGRRVLVVGTGEAADRRAATLAQAGATVIRGAAFVAADLHGCARHSRPAPPRPTCAR